jgi:hypothetical protein
MGHTSGFLPGIIYTGPCGVPEPKTLPFWMSPSGSCLCLSPMCHLLRPELFLRGLYLFPSSTLPPLTQGQIELRLRHQLHNRKSFWLCAEEFRADLAHEKWRPIDGGIFMGSGGVLPHPAGPCRSSPSASDPCASPSTALVPGATTW